MRVLLLALGLCLLASSVIAAPTKKEASGFVKEVEAAVKANRKAMADGPDAIRVQNQRYQALELSAKRSFVDADACSFAAKSAQVLWVDQLRYLQKPDQLNFNLIQRHHDDYQDNMKLCKQSLSSFR